MSIAPATIRITRTNDDPNEDTWQWVLVVAGNRTACSWKSFVSPRAARNAARRAADSLDDAVRWQAEMFDARTGKETVL